MKKCCAKTDKRLHDSLKKTIFKIDDFISFYMNTFVHYVNAFSHYLRVDCSTVVIVVSDADWEMKSYIFKSVYLNIVFF